MNDSVFSNPSVQAVALEGGTLLKLSTMLATSRPMSVKKKVIILGQFIVVKLWTVSEKMLVTEGLQSQIVLSLYKE